MLPEILFTGVCANVSSEMTETYFKRPQKAVMVLCNSSFSKVKPKGAFVFRITHRRMEWLIKRTLKIGVW